MARAFRDVEDFPKPLQLLAKKSMTFETLPFYETPVPPNPKLFYSKKPIPDFLENSSYIIGPRFGNHTLEWGFLLSNPNIFTASSALAPSGEVRSGVSMLDFASDGARYYFCRTYRDLFRVMGESNLETNDFNGFKINQYNTFIRNTFAPGS